MKSVSFRTFRTKNGSFRGIDLPESATDLAQVNEVPLLNGQIKQLTTFE